MTTSKIGLYKFLIVPRVFVSPKLSVSDLNWRFLLGLLHVWLWTDGNKLPYS